MIELSAVQLTKFSKLFSKRADYYYYYYHYYYNIYHFYPGIYNDLPEINNVSRAYNVVGALYLQFLLHVILFTVSAICNVIYSFCYM
jgi:hypothetical protein